MSHDIKIMLQKKIQLGSLSARLLALEMVLQTIPVVVIVVVLQFLSFPSPVYDVLSPSIKSGHPHKKPSLGEWVRDGTHCKIPHG